MLVIISEGARPGSGGAGRRTDAIAGCALAVVSRPGHPGAVRLRQAAGTRRRPLVEENRWSDPIPRWAPVRRTRRRQDR